MFCSKSNFLRSMLISKLCVILSLIIFGVFSQTSLANQFPEDLFPEDLKAELKCIEENTSEYCALRHSNDGRVICINSDRATAEAVNWKNSKLHGLRNDCKFKVEVAQFGRSDGAVILRVSAESGEVFAVNFRPNGIGFKACRSPLQPVYDSDAILDYRCVKKQSVSVNKNHPNK